METITLEKLIETLKENQVLNGKEIVEYDITVAYKDGDEIKTLEIYS